MVDNGPQFDSIAFKTFCSELTIRNLFSTSQYPHSNGQVEATNKILLSALKKMLEKAKGRWVDELPRILWAYRTTNMKHSLCSRLWDACNYPNKNKHAHSPNYRPRPDGRESRTWKTPRLDKQGKGKCSHLSGFLSATSYCPLQWESLAMCL